MNTGLDQYMDVFKDAVEDSAAKLTKSFKKILIEVIILFMVIPRKINFTQMGRYGSHVEQTYRNAFSLKKSKCIDWLKLNVSLAKRFFGKQGRWAIAIDPSYISKAGKKTPHIGRFWSGCAQSVKHGLEIMGIGLVDIDAKDSMMLRAHQSLSNKELSLRNKTMVDFYISVIKRYRKELLKLSTLIVADAYFSTSTFVNGIKKEGFSLISRFRVNACLFYVYAGPRTGKRGRPKTKDGKIDMKNLDLTRMEKMEMKDIEGTAYTLIAYSKALKCKVRLVIWQIPNGKKKLFFSTDTSGEEVLLYYRTWFQIEFYFKWIKQHLHIKSFYGTSENAIYLQIWIAICTYLLLAYAKKVMHIDQSLHTISKNVGLFLTDKTPLNEYLTKLFQQKRRRIGYILAFSDPMISKRDSSVPPPSVPTCLVADIY